MIASEASNSALSFSTPGPTITGISPSQGLLGGTDVTIYGTNLQNATQVSFGSLGDGTIQPGSDGPFSLVVETPIELLASPATVNVEVQTPQGAFILEDGFTFLPPPIITSVSPQTGPGGGNEIVELQGTNLNGVTSVYFGANQAPSTAIRNTSARTARRRSTW